ncbi:ATP-binding protein [Candidatus Parabeggiatoa sp. HSG14]|uniref:sensor histidine kinase n=1 Tax=Candidatus Parabeggiatoa sp. HSG14 TaxID=3055593 RepID=UPI0025A6E0F4|nr:ATP-binding protein [Thiotrichales bacterium HSG14]
MLERTDIIPTAIQIDSDTTAPDWKPLSLFNLYRFTVATVFAGTFVAEVSPSFLGQFNKDLFLITSWLYSGFAIFCFFTIARQWPPFNVQVIGQILLDIFAITVLMYASGGVSSGLGMLLVVVIAGGSLLTEGRTAFFFAAVASLCVLVHVTLSDLLHWFPYTSYSHAGMLGITFFTTAFLAHTLARRVRTSEALAKQRGLHVQYLAQLNAQIVQHIETGIMVIDIVGRIRLFNESARRLLGLNEQPNGRTLNSIAPKLAERLTNWKKNNLTKSPLFRPTKGEVDVIATFTKLDRGGTVNVLIMLEDATLMTQRAQQLKLASLGRLTVSIAHEIRNPLGIILNAGELLIESPDISQEDTELTETIIKHSQRINTIIENVRQLSRHDQAKSECFDLHIWLQSYIEEFIIQHNLTTVDVVLCANHPSLMVYVDSNQALVDELITQPDSMTEDVILPINPPPLMVCFDPDQLYQVIGNLCENGLRYSQGSPLLQLTIGISEELGRPYLDVRDHGHGMTEKIKAQVFEPFFTTESQGTGLGLYLSREICAANQATLHLFSNTSAGCCFRIYFSSEI